MSDSRGGRGGGPGGRRAGPQGQRDGYRQGHPMRRGERGERPAGAIPGPPPAERLGQPEGAVVGKVVVLRDTYGFLQADSWAGEWEHPNPPRYFFHRRALVGGLKFEDLRIGDELSGVAVPDPPRGVMLTKIAKVQAAQVG